MGAGRLRAVRDARQHEVYPPPEPHVKQPRPHPRRSGYLPLPLQWDGTTG